MEQIRRVYVEKNPDVDAHSKAVLRDLRENLGIRALTGVRVLTCYDVAGVDDAAFELCSDTIFSEPPVDTIYEETFPIAAGEVCFSVKYLPGQFDQRADSCMQCAAVVLLHDKAVIESSSVYVLKGELTTGELDRIKNFLINPVEAMEVPTVKPEVLNAVYDIPEDIRTHEGFIHKNDAEISEMRNSLGLAMTKEDLIFCRDYFRDTQRRDPTYTEIKVIDTYWSDHCRHTTFLTTLTDIGFEEGPYKELFEGAYRLYLNERRAVYGEKDRDITLMDLAVIGMKALRKKGLLDNLDSSEEINACSIVIDVDVNGKTEEWLLMFKNETHNHPTEIEPFGGAATCLGGAIRDPLAGRAYVYQAMRVTGAGDPRVPVSETLAGKLPQIKLTTGAAAGFSSYGNQVGLATGQVTEIYHEGYVAKRLETGMVVGAVKKDRVNRLRPVSGDVVILVGGRTGRDGCGGATGSSLAHSEESLASCGAQVQKGNAPTERKLQRFFRNERVCDMIKRCNDFGAGGVSVAVGELADGLEIELDSVRKKYEGLDGTELAISESQERMAVVVSEAEADIFIGLAKDENLEAAVIARVTDTNSLVMNWRGKRIVDISRDFLNTNGARQHARVLVKSPDKKETNVSADAALLQYVLGDLNIASQKGLAERFDSTVGAGTVLMPFGGVNQLTPAQAMAARIPVEEGDTNTVSIAAFGYDPYVSTWSPFHGAYCACIESVAKIAASGGNFRDVRMSFQEYFERPEKDPSRWGKPFAALLGAFDAQMKLKLAAIGGKDSMSGSFNEMSVPPTLISFAVCPGKDRNIISPEFKRTGSLVILLETPYTADDLPDTDIFMANCEKLYTLIQRGQVLAASTVGAGGVAAKLAQMSFGNMIGVSAKCDNLYAARYGSFILETPLSGGALEAAFEGTRYACLGITTDAFDITINGHKTDISQLIAAWLAPLERVFPTGWLDENSNETDVIVYGEPGGHAVPEIRRSAGVRQTYAKPRVLIPAFPGTNGEYDMKKAFEKAGAETSIFVVKNLSLKQIDESAREMARIIGESQIIALPGGFSAGDEPDGSGKFIAALFRNPFIAESVEELLNMRDGLMLGICNGFQALIKLGLLPLGKISPLTRLSPTLTYNAIGRHVSCLSRVRVVTNRAPWLSGCKPGDVFLTAVSHGEGRFYADESIIKELIAKGQIATQYVDFLDNPTMDIRFNPNGSAYAIEGIISPNGRVLGKMGHAERIDNTLCKNVPGPKVHDIFGAGILYYS